LIFIVIPLLACSSAPPKVTTPAIPPVFDGEAVAADTPPPPLAGATVRIVSSAAGAFAFASDPDEDSVHIVSLGTAPALVGTVALQSGDQPNRIVGDRQGRAQVLLRGGGAIATIDTSGNIVARRNVCPAPRGIDYDAINDQLWVACATGELVTMPSDGPISRSVRVDMDLRDVVLDGGKVWVTRFRSTELLEIGSDGTILSRSNPLQSGTFSMIPTVAWRAARKPSGGPIVVHQLAASVPLVVKPATSYYGDTPSPISVAAITDGNVTTPLDVNQVVDVTFGANGDYEALSILGDVALPSGDVHIADESPRAIFTGIDDGNARGIPWVAIQRRSPMPALLLLQVLSPGSFVPTVSVPLSTNSHADTAFDLFHLPTLVGAACMNCHPEGGDDGHVWTFAVSNGSSTTTTQRVRRTQSLAGGSTIDTAPYHWDGDLADMQALLDEVFTHRMGGGSVTPTQTALMTRWMAAIPAPPKRSDLDAQSVARGQSMFTGSAGCTQCHGGARGTLEANQDVGKIDSLGASEPTQVPMLLGLSTRAPYMHDGCAHTIMDRLTDPQCAGSKHGDTSKLSQGDLVDLEAYLQSL
jgi:hypothetical protein